MPDDPISLPWEARVARPNLFDPPEVFGRLRDERPLRPMTFADGHVGWLATGYRASRAILADNRFSIRRELSHPAFRTPKAGEHGAFSAPATPGLFSRMDPPDHTRYRRLLAGEFTARRMRQLDARIVEVTRGCLDAMEQAGPPADLVEALAYPLPTLVICELLGVPADGRDEFQQATAVAFDPDTTPAEARRAFAAMAGIFPPLIASKRESPTDDIYSGLVNGSDLTEEELTGVGVLLFVGGFETTANILGLGTLALLQHPDQLETLRSDPSLADGAVEELLRYLNGPAGMQRTATEDVEVEVEGELIREGQTVELLPAAANRDPARFEDPDKLDVTRPPHAHLSFGHGIHQCIGAQLARAELRVAFPALFQRFPGLRLAVPPEEVPQKSESVLFGVKQLPVAW